MRLLLDTHAFLWFVLGDPLLCDYAKSLILDTDNEKLVSPASYWEIAIKTSIGKLSLNAPYEVFIRRGIEANGFVILPITIKQTAAVSTMPFHHRDPFDRLLVAQALVEDIPLVSADPTLDAYGIKRLW